jgi:DNA-binding response OmpR family regulator
MKNLNILIVENEAIVALDLQQIIQNFGYYSVEIASNSQIAITLAIKTNPNLIFMDINLNDKIDGIETYKLIQKQLPAISVIYLTAYTDDDTINKAINTDPLGYLVKPFNEEELKAILNLANFKIKGKNKLYIGHNYYFDQEKQKLFFNDISVHLSKKELKLLTLLIKAKGNTLEFEYLEREIWTEKVVTNSALRTLLHRLRAKLNYKLIITIPCYGCYLEL